MDACTELLECGICTEAYGDARFLECGHTFCYQCLQKLHRPSSDAITCPNCRKPTALKRNGVAGLVVNFYVDKVKEVHCELMKLKQEEINKIAVITHLEETTETLRKDNADLQATISQRDFTLKSNEKFARNLKRNSNRKTRKIQIKLEESQEECSILCAKWQLHVDNLGLLEELNRLDLQQTQDMCDSLKDEITKKSSECISYSYNLKLSNTKYRNLEIEFNQALTKCANFQKRLGLLEEDCKLLNEELQHTKKLCDSLKSEMRMKNCSYSYNVKLSNAKYCDLEIKLNRAQAKCTRLQTIIKENDERYFLLEHQATSKSESLKQENKELNNLTWSLIVAFIVVIIISVYMFTRCNILAFIDALDGMVKWGS